MKFNRFIVLKRLSKQIKVPVPLVLILQIVAVVSTGVSMVSPYLYSLLVDEVMTNRKVHLLYFIIPAMIGIFIVDVGLSALATVLSVRYNNAVNLEVKTKLFHRLMKNNIADSINADIGTEQKLIEQDSSTVSGFFTGQIGGFLTTFLYVAIYLTLMVIINPWLSLAVIIFIPLTILFGKYIGRKFNVNQNALWEIGAKNNNFLFDTIQKWREVKAQNLEDHLTKEYKDKLQPERKTLISWMLYFALNGVFYDIKNGFVNNILMYFLGGLFIISGQLTIGSLLMFMSYMSSFTGNIDSIIKSITDFSGNRAVYDRLFEALEYKDTPKESVDNKNLDIFVENVTYAYGNDLPQVLSNISYRFSFGKKYLIIGKSGEGKSTLIKLLLSMMAPNKGDIRLGNLDLSCIEQQSLFKKMTAVMQENQFFNLSIRENLLMIAPEATDEQIDFACKSAEIFDFINSLPNGYDTIIGERGIKLSGGQKQRLAIARLILHNPSIVILDEATSSLDTVTETKILTNLNEIFKDKTLIVISHKPALQISFDEIISVENNMLLSSGVK